ncbi:unnamed protein product, partial [marine sediment metagenome]
ATILISVVIVNLISQEEHKMLQLLAESKRRFLAVKFVNIIIASIMGIIGYLTGI